MAAPMVLTRGRRLIYAAALCFSGGMISHAQSAAPPGLPVGTEMESLEKKLGRADLSGAERHEALIRLARLRQLSGDVEGAARSWLEAAAALSGAEADERAGRALVTGAACLAAIGEWDEAAAALAPLLASGQQGPALLRARYVNACLAAWKSGDASALSALADDPGSAPLKSAIYYTLWKTAVDSSGPAGAENWKVRLLAEFPRSPEGRIATAESEGASPLVSAQPSPFWLLFPGRGGFSVETPSAVPAAALPAVPPPASESAIRQLQTGLYRGEANARAQIDRLKDAGFSASLLRRQVNGAEYWAVTVPAGRDMTRTMLELKNAGFESFPLE